MYKKFFKRIIDLFIAIVAMPFFVFLFIPVALCIFIDDGFPIFYNSNRIGLNGKVFKMYKFRSMKRDAPDIRLTDGSTYNGKDDPRVTRIGKVLRRTSIDELPQLFNILKGDMSLIGPRPDPPDWIDKYPNDISFFLKLRPGLTGYNQAFYRNSADARLKMKNDAYYAMNCTLSMDFKIFIKTITSVLGYQNTYKDLSQEVNQLDKEAQKLLNLLKK